MTQLPLNQHYSLQSHNTLGFNQQAEHFVIAHTEQQIEQAVALANDKQWPIMVIGEGSNIVLTKDIPGLVVRLGDDSIRYSAANSNDEITVSVGAGTNWHHLVSHTLQYGLIGLENLSLIPGTVGAAPVQNIGAYGVEIRSRLTCVRAFDIHDRQWREFSAEDCDFSYRHSVFKKNAGRYIINRVDFQLGRMHNLTYDYHDLRRYLEERHQIPPTALQISAAVISIRQSKLPDPGIIGNAGSFFHNPIVSRQQSLALREQFPELPIYELDAHSVKLSAGWMIDSLGFKGYRQHGVGVYDKQALVLVHIGGASGQQIIELATHIIDRVKKRFDVQLQIEPVVV